MRRIARVFWVLALLGALVACGQQPADKTLDEITVQLKWVHQAQFAGLYVAREKGYYAQEGIKVNFLEGGQGIDSAAAVISGKAQFGVVAPEDVLILRSRGGPLKAIAAIYRRSAVVFLALAGSGIVRPHDFLDKTVASGGEGGAVRDLEFQFHALVKKLGPDISRIRVVPYDPKYTGFIKGDVDVTPAFSTGGLIRLRQEGLTLNLIWPSDYGIHFYSDTLVATDETFKANPDLVTRFLRATLKGWRDAIGNSDEAVATTLKYARVKDPQLQTAMMEGLLPLVHTGEDQIGWMKPAVWQGMYNVLLEQKILSAPFEVDQAYTMHFLEEISEGGTK
jgi:NitT/TauT family transport system substrate-binding protein